MILSHCGEICDLEEKPLNSYNYVNPNAVLSRSVSEAIICSFSDLN